MPCPVYSPSSHSSVPQYPSIVAPPPSTSVSDLRLLNVPSVPQLEHPTLSNPPHGAPIGPILRFPRTLHMRRYGLHGTTPRQLFPRAHFMRTPTPGYTRVYRQRGFL
jgi:hypothetical protein